MTPERLSQIQDDLASMKVGQEWLGVKLVVNIGVARELLAEVERLQEQLRQARQDYDALVDRLGKEEAARDSP